MTRENPSYGELAALVAAQAAEIARLKARITDLERQLAANSRNSSKPPSTDGYIRPSPKSLRVKTDRGRGKQKGAPGKALRQVDTPDEVLDHEPAECTGCGDDLTGATPQGMVRRQVHDLPRLRPVVTEHRMHRRQCRHCNTITTAAAPAEATAPACYGVNVTALAAYLLTYQHIPVARTAQLLADVAGMPVSTGWVAGVLERTHEQLGEFVDRVDTALKTAPVVHFDETGVRAADRIRWLHTASTDTLTAYFLHDRRGKAALDEFGILPVFTGIAVHDGFASYGHYLHAAHARCNAHHLRELVAVAEANPDQKWPSTAKDLLERLNAAAHAARDAGLDHIPTDVLNPLIWQWDHTILVGRSHHPFNATTRHGATRQTPTRKLLDRLTDYRKDTLRFAHDLRVPFTNNQAERDLRMTKAQLKISGCWRTLHGARFWLRVRAYISTVRKNGRNPLTELRNALVGLPWLPAATR